MIVNQLFEDDDKKKKLNEHGGEDCDLCNGTGEGLFDGESCHKCDGTGTIGGASDDDYYDDEEDYGGDDGGDDESYYEKYVRTRNLESRLNEFDMPVGQATGTGTNSDDKPRQTYSVKVVGHMTIPDRTFTAENLWLSLESILPRDYPRVPFQKQSGKEPQRRVLDDITDDGFSIIKQGINSQDVAETIANKFESKGIPAEVIDGGLYEEGSMDPVPEFYAGQEITWRPKFAKMIPVPVTVVAAAPGKLKIKLQSPRMIQNYGKEVIVVNVADSDIMPKQGVAEAIPHALSAANANAEHERGMRTIKVPRTTLKKQGKPVGEVSIDLDASPGNGPWYFKHYASGKEYGGYDSKEEAMAELKYLVKQSVSEGKRNKQRKLNEAMLMEDPVYRKFKNVSRYIVEYKMSEKQILDVFAQAEAGMTDKGTGANRTMLGRGKDTAMDFAGGVKDAVSSVLSSIQNSVPVAAVDVAYDQATDALANVAGGQKGAVMQAIKKYRNLVKQYPKTAGFAKAALVAIAGLATGGAGLPAIAGLTYALDSAIKGDKLSSVIGKGAGAAALSAAGQAVHGAMSHPNTTDAMTYGDGSNYGGPDYQDTTDTMTYGNGDEFGGPDYQDSTDAMTYGPDQYGGPEGAAGGADDGGGMAGQFDGGQYTVQKGDQIGYIAQANGVKTMDIEGLNPQIDFSKPLQPGMTLNLPPQGDGAGSVWDGYTGGNYGDKVAGAASNTSQGMPSHPSAASDYGVGGNAPIDYTQPGPMSTDSLGQKLEYGMPVNDQGSFIPPNLDLPPDELASQQAAYSAWKSDFMRRFPNATELPDGSMQNIKPGLNTMQILQKPTLPAEVQESVKFKKLSFDKLIDEKSTVMDWALSESIGIKRKSVTLSAVGTLTVFENVDRCRKAIMELKGVPGSTRPAQYRPDMPGGAGVQSKPGMIGRGLNWLDKAAGKVGGALSNFGHQFTTGVTKEKLKMNWHQAGKPSDSDQLAAWLVKQGVPQEVVTTVYGKMGIPYTAPGATPATANPTQDATAGKAEKELPWVGPDLKTGANRTVDQLTAQPAAGPAPAPAAPGKMSATAGGPAGFNAGNIFKQPGMEKYAKPAAAPAKVPNFGMNAGYGKVNQPTSVSYSGMPGMKPAAAPTTAKLPAGGGAGVKSAGEPGQLSKDEYIKRIGATPMPESRIVSALKKPVAEMLSMVETKEDVNNIKKFIDQTFTKYGAVNESAFAVRNKMIEHVTQVGAQRRREFARKS